MNQTGPAIAEALGQAHATLLEDLRQLEEAVCSTAKPEPAQLTARLETTQRHIAEHFRFEEQNGYLEVVRKREPRLERATQQLAAEHQQLARALEALRAEARSAPRLDNGLREKVKQWVESVRQHEVRENDLVQDAFDLDIGAED